jgi:hypothetical protein
VLALLLLAALVTAGPPWRRALGLALAVAAALWPLTLDGTPLARGTAALLTFWSAARVLDLARERRPLAPAHRMAHAVAILDTRKLRRVPAWFDRVDLLAAAAWLLVAVHARAAAEQHLGDLPLRWALGALFLYAAAEAANSLAKFGLAAFGFHGPTLHDTPIAARSLREFWGERWNISVSRWLRAHIFLPLARRRRARLGLVLAFLASAGLHAWSVGVALGPRMALSMGSFFLIQAGLAALEGRMRVDRWPELAARVWTLGAVLLPSPLFVEPLLRVFEAGRLLLG